MGSFNASDCRRFITATDGRDTPELLVRAMGLIPSGRALELGCGAGDDAITLASSGFTVTVVDEFQDAVESARAKGNEAGVIDQLDLHVERFESFDVAAAAFDLVHARFSLPFCRPGSFEQVWSAIRAGLRPGGVFAGQLFGPHDDFVRNPDRAPMTAQTRPEVETLLDGLEILHLEEVEQDGVTATGREKHWHVHHMLWRTPDG